MDKKEKDEDEQRDEKGNKGNGNVTSALIASFQYELQKISERSFELENLLKKIYSALDIRLGSEEVKKVLELKGMIDESARWLTEIKEDIDNTSQSVSNLKEEILALKQQNRKNEERIESLRNYILNAGPSAYDVVGLIGASALIVTSMLIYLDKWDVVRAWYYPMVFGALIAVAAVSTIINQRTLRRRMFGGGF